MPLKNKYTDLKEIPAEDVRLYLERNGEWVLDAEGDGSKTKLEEFRANNIALSNQLKRFEGIDPDAVRQLAAEKARLEEEQRLKDGKFQEVLADKLKVARAEFAPVVAERDALTGKLSALLIDQAVVTEATKRGLRPTAIPDATARARVTFKLVAGVPQAFDGDVARYGRDGTSLMTLAEWVAALVSDAPHLFEANAGGGAAGSGSRGAGSGVVNPFRKETWNLTEQTKLLMRDPGLAARLQASA
jgi:hypothetical protein